MKIKPELHPTAVSVAVFYVSGVFFYLMHRRLSFLPYVIVRSISIRVITL